VAGIAKIVDSMRGNPAQVRYADLYKICVAYFGEPRQSGSSHAVFKTPWPGDPRVNIQNAKGKAKPYQVRQVLLALERLQEKSSADEKGTMEKHNEPQEL
jgi:hypothetical protein